MERLKRVRETLRNKYCVMVTEWGGVFEIAWTQRVLRCFVVLVFWSTNSSMGLT